MSKPLELTVYPTFWMSGTLWTSEAPNASVVYPLDVDTAVSAKRFTDAELAAEYHAERAQFEHMGFNEISSGGDWDDETWERLANPVNVLHRFATLPIYDEDQP